MEGAPVTPEDKHCSFCVQPSPDLIEGALGNICPDCVRLCVEVIDMRKNPRPDTPEEVALKNAIEGAIASALRHTNEG